jgi:type IV secretory pathway TrbD component
MTEAEPEGFRVQITQALLEPMLWAGVPRKFGIANAVATSYAVLGRHWWWALPVGLGLHGVVRLLTKHDPYWLEVLGRYMRYKRFYES